MDSLFLSGINRVKTVNTSADFGPKTFVSLALSLLMVASAIGCGARVPPCWSSLSPCHSSYLPVRIISEYMFASHDLFLRPQFETSLVLQCSKCNCNKSCLLLCLQFSFFPAWIFTCTFYSHISRCEAGCSRCQLEFVRRDPISPHDTGLVTCSIIEHYHI